MHCRENNCNLCEKATEYRKEEKAPVSEPSPEDILRGLSDYIESVGSNKDRKYRKK